MLEVANSGKLSLIGTEDSANSVFFLKNESIYARKQGDFVSGYSSRYNTVYGVNGPSLTSNADYNTAIGYQSANDRMSHQGSVFLGAGAGYDIKGRNSVLIGKKPIVLSGNDTIYEYNSVINIGNDTQVNNSDETVVIGNNNRNIHENSSRRLSRNTIVGHGNINHSNDATLVGYKNYNQGSKSVIIGKNVKNYGSDSLLIYPKDKDGNATGFVNNEDNYINIFGVITGSNDGLNFNKDVTFTSAKILSNLEVGEDVRVGGDIEASNVKVKSNLEVENDLFVKGAVNIETDLFIKGSNITQIVESSETSSTQLQNQIVELQFLTTNINSEVLSIGELALNNANYQASNFDSLSNMINDNGIDILQNRVDIDNINATQCNLELFMDELISDQIETQFNSMIQKAIDGTYVFNIVRDSLTTFPSFNAETSLCNYEKMKFYDGNPLNLDPASHVFGNHITKWEILQSNVEQEMETTHTRNLHTSNVILHESNYFKNETYFGGKVICSNNLAVGSNLFVKGVLQSFSNQLVINDNVLIHEALHVSDFIQTNAIKADWNFNNHCKIFSNLTFSNDWALFTSNNPNNSNLKDLVIKGTNRGSEGMETTFTDFIPGQLNFTGQHRCTFSSDIDDVDNYAGFIVSASGRYMDLNDKESIDIDDAIPIVSISDKSYDTRVFGVISHDEDTFFPGDSKKRCFQIGTMKFSTLSDKKSKKIIINSVGEGGIWVCNQNGNIYNGDLIVSSDRPGYGMRQKDCVYCNYTVAKATCDAIFSSNDSMFIGCTYKC